MSAAATQPLDPQTEVVEYAERIRARLAALIIGSFVGVVAMWTLHAPQLPGDTAGIIIGSFTTALGMIVQAYWSKK
jgi:hypothetical protein